MNRCPRCGTTTEQPWCCGVDLHALAPWQMTPERVRIVHVLARSQKGLSEEQYRLQLGALGVSSSRMMSRAQFYAFVQRMRSLPDSPKWTARRQESLQRVG
ncbi:MAG: hypothetical protein ABT19_03245 [Rhodanobacter sp. SCN 68-63]|nr:MAG: hypothetical protein ABT19_03245 [Rhodanobacter sp. SCN 68-63]